MAGGEQQFITVKGRVIPLTEGHGGFNTPGQGGGFHDEEGGAADELASVSGSPQARLEKAGISELKVGSGFSEADLTTIADEQDQMRQQGFTYAPKLIKCGNLTPGLMGENRGGVLISVDPSEMPAAQRDGAEAMEKFGAPLHVEPTVAGVYRHEYAHGVEASVPAEAIKKHFEDVRAGEPSDFIAKNVSISATASPSEYFAEAFAKVMAPHYKPGSYKYEGEIRALADHAKGSK